MNDPIAFRACPLRLVQLIIPTYTIDVNVCLDNDHTRRQIDTMTFKNRIGLINFTFTPRLFQNNVYFGKLIINGRNGKCISLKRMLKSVDINSVFNGFY